MLSKRQAKFFFIGGTVVFFLIFVAMTVHSVTVGIPENTHAENLSEKAKLGKELWEVNNCMGCHTIMGEGAYYAPELTRVFSRKGPNYIRAVVTSKEGWAPRGRKMVAYDFTEEEVEGLVAFFEWMDKTDLNGFPAKPSL
ncbi:MAG TPA: cytochrome c [Bacteroidetes bacterium]|nr:cytochrome c [Bacteroidota bacterium]